MKRISVFLLCMFAVSVNARDSVPGKIVAGKFNPAGESGFVNLSSLGIQVKNGPHYLQREAAEHLARMMKDFLKENPKVPFWVQSSTRNFSAQKYIWNAKWRGEKPSGAGKTVHEKDPVKRAKMILEYSSMPGTSRHHWGTDADFNVLTNDYYEHGDGKVLFTWLTKNASRYGFARPYTALRSKGYHEERWHWSYTPISKKYLREWMSLYSQNNRFFIEKESFDGANEVYQLAAEYVESISAECK